MAVWRGWNLGNSFHYPSFYSSVFAVTSDYVFFILKYCMYNIFCLIIACKDFMNIKGHGNTILDYVAGNIVVSFSLVRCNVPEVLKN
jgi:hypothetical protein